MIDNNPFDLVQFAGSEAVIGRQQNGIEPKLGLIASGFDMDMRRFLAFVAEEVEAEPANA